MFKRVLAACALVALALPTAASAKRSQFTIFQATREVRSADPAVRAQALDEISALGVRWLRVVLYWQDVAPDVDAGQVPDFDETDPGAYPGWALYDRVLADARARDLRVLVTISGPGPRWATRSREDRVTRPSPTRFGRFVDRCRTPLWRAGRLLVDLERAEPPAVPRAAVLARAPVFAEAVPEALPRRPRGSRALRQRA